MAIFCGSRSSRSAARRELHGHVIYCFRARKVCLNPPVTTTISTTAINRSDNRSDNNNAVTNSVIEQPPPSSPTKKPKKEINFSAFSKILQARFVSEDGKKVDYTSLRQSSEYAKYRETGIVLYGPGFHIIILRKLYQ
jgi:hypothetical protein